MMRTGSRSFSAAGHLLPRRVSGPATALYAFCRLADDLIDAGDGADRQEHLAGLRRRLERAYAGDPLDHSADRAFAAAVAQHAIPRALPLALLEGLSWDVEGRCYDDLDALLGYAARVAGSVGAMMAVLMGVRSAPALARACDLGVAMQLTNIARDVGEDARAGRVYLPLDWLDEAGVPAVALLAEPRFSDALGSVVARLLQVADVLYMRGLEGVEFLPLSCRPGIRAAALLYREIGHALAQGGHDSVARRAHVPARRKVALLAQALLPRTPAAPLMRQQALPACQYLVDAAARETALAGSDFQAKLNWVFDLFERLAEQQIGTS